MYDIDAEIKNIDHNICREIDWIGMLSRAEVSQVLLKQTRDLVEHVALKEYALHNTILNLQDSLKHSVKHLPQKAKFEFIRKFHLYIQESESHYTPTDDGAERLMVKYYEYLIMLRDFCKREYNLEILHNLDSFPINTDETVIDYYRQVKERLRVLGFVDQLQPERYYVMRSKPVVVDGELIYENNLLPASDYTSKFDRFIAFSNFLLPDHYAIRVSIKQKEIAVDGRHMPVNLLEDFDISIRPCELNNFAKIFGHNIKMESRSAEYQSIMNYLKVTGLSLTELILLSDNEYLAAKSKLLERPRTVQFIGVLDEAREIVHANAPGCNIVRYLLHTLHNRVIKQQLDYSQNTKLSNLYLSRLSIPFDEMPIATNPRGHISDLSDVLECIDSTGREHEFISRIVQTNTRSKGSLYTKRDDLSKYDNLDQLIVKFNDNLFYSPKQQRRKIKSFGKYLYIEDYYEDTKDVLTKLLSYTTGSVKNYRNYVNSWLDDPTVNVDSEEKKSILQGMFADTRLTMIYGAAGTGKTHLIHHIAQLFDERSKLFLAYTHTAVDNLNRKVKASNCKYLTISSFTKSKNIKKDYDLIFIDECSMVSNSEMNEILKQADFKLLILVGDTYQIESLTFGNWFSLARYFIPRKAWNELKDPFRTKNNDLLELWRRVREFDGNITEFLVKNHYSSSLDDSLFEKKCEDEIILCLNYNGLYGINNINRFLQNNNPGEAVQWGLWPYKVGDPVLFNDCDRFSPVLYNNLKGWIVGIELLDDSIQFDIELEKVVNGLEADDAGLELLDQIHEGRSVVRFTVDKDHSFADEDDVEPSTVVPFQIAYAVSIHKAQGLEYDSVKVVITEDIDEMITHNIFYTAITRAKKYLKIYWSPESQHRVVDKFDNSSISADANIFSAHSGMKIINKRI